MVSGQVFCGLRSRLDSEDSPNVELDSARNKVDVLADLCAQV